MDKYQAAVEALLEEIEEKSREIAETKRIVNGLLRRAGQPPMFSDIAVDESGAGSIRPDMFYGRPLSTAVRELLELRGGRNRGALSSEEIVKGLETGGFDFKGLGWSTKDAERIRVMSITLAKNSQIFHRLPNGRFGLLAWYPEVSKRSDRAGKQRVSGNGEQSTDDGDENGAQSAGT